MQVVTAATRAMLPSARVLGSSLLRHNPGWSHRVLLLTRSGQERPENDGPALSEVLDVDLEQLLLRHRHGHAAALLAPKLLEWAARNGEGPVLHLPASAWVLGPLEPLLDVLRAAPVALVARVSADPPGDGLEPSARQLAAAGRISELAIASDGTAAATPFLSWWSSKLERALGTLDGTSPGGRPEDLPWLWRMLELAPARFGFPLLEPPDWNLSMWNLHRHSLARFGATLTADGGHSLRFMDLSGFDPRRPFRLSPMASRVRLSRSPLLRELCVDYAEQLVGAGWEQAHWDGEVGRRLPGGLVFDDPLRDLHACAVALGEDVEDVFGERGAAAFCEWLEGPAPQGAAWGINRYLYRRLARERPDVLHAYPHLDGPDGRECAAWCWAFGRTELGLPDRFLPGRGHSGGGDAGPAPAEAPGEAQPPPLAEGRPQQGPPHPSRDGEMPAVRLTGYMNHALGLGAAARAYAQALSAAGVATTTASVPLHHLELPVELTGGYGLHSFEELVHDGKHAFEIVAVNPDELPGLVERLGEGYFQGPRIGIWGWETNSVPARWAQAFGLVDEIWVYSRFMAENIGAVAPVPVVALPPPVTAPAGAVEPLRLGLPNDCFLFLFAFDYLSTVRRKNPTGLIEAFKRAFAPGEGPKLLIKTLNAPLRPLSEEELLWLVDGREDIAIVDRSLTQDERDGLMAGCDCYVSLHRAEGFGLTMAEAMALGKPVIGTAYSGNTDFMTDRNSYLVDYEMTRVGPDCEIYPAEGEWAEPSVEHAAELMRTVWERRDEAAERGRVAAQDIARRLSPEATGAAILSRLRERDGAGSGPPVSTAGAGARV